MARHCSVCVHQKRSEIEGQLRSGATRGVAEAWPDLSSSALHRHRAGHMDAGAAPPVIPRLEILQHCESEVLQILEDESIDPYLKLQALSELRCIAREKEEVEKKPPRSRPAKAVMSLE